MKRAVLTCLLLALTACGGTRQANDATAPSAPSPTMGSSSDPEPDGSGPRNSFIVCPGNPRCPPEGSQPKGREGN